MPDDRPPDVWSERFKNLALVIAAFSGLVGAIGSCVNHDKISTVQERQEASSEKLDAAAKAAVDAKRKTEETAVKADAKLSSIEKTVKSIADE